MRSFLLILIFFTPFCAAAQVGIGMKGGLNFANVINASDINANSRTGFMIGGYVAPKAKKLLGFRSEFILSRQGYNFKTGTTTGDVNLDYLLLPQLITINFTKKVQVQAGGQLAFLLNACVDSSGSGSAGGNLFDYFKRFDYGLATGLEVFPLKGFFIGARLNISLNDVSEGGTRPHFIPDVNAKNNVVQLYTGWRF
ncbi:MAG: PorT family protein [Ferruginibacter sp.]|nr:PorT family protein [Chitinophagaceae bacterium]